MTAREAETRAEVELSADDIKRLERVVSAPFRVYQPTAGGGREWAPLIRTGLVHVEDVGDEQETILRVSATPAGRARLATPTEQKP